jgi:hypothetical protein
VFRKIRDRAWIHAALALAAVGASAVLASCQAPCDALAGHICSCKPNQVEENACVQGVKQQMSGRSLTSQDQSTCNALLQTCTCAALENGDLVACGLSTPP